jgi:hypothetical protein
MTVVELIEFLKTHPQDMPILFRQYSDYTELRADQIGVEEHQVPRGDGYVGSKRPDRPSQKFLVFPGN